MFERPAGLEPALVGTALHIGPANDERVLLVFKDENSPDVLVDDMVREFPYQSARVLLPLFALLLLATAGIVWRAGRAHRFSRHPPWHARRRAACPW